MKSLFRYNDNDVILSTLQKAICKITEEKTNYRVRISSWILELGF